MLNSEFNEKITSVADAEIYFNEPMKNHTTFKIGGPADVFAVAKTVFALQDIILLCRENDVPYHMVGAGSNLLVSDKGIRGVVIKYNSKSALCSGDIIDASAGISLSALAKFAYTNSLTGLEFAGGIPGLLSGAVYMNAGAYGGEMKDIIIETEYMDADGNMGKIVGKDHKFGYRHSVYCDGDKIILSAKMKLGHGDKNEIGAKMNDLLKRRNDKQPLTYPSAGSTFKRPEGYFAGKLIEDSGLKGFSVGGAQVSEKHAGFVINTGNATACDVLNLVEHIKNTVMKNFGVELQCEIKTMGEF